MLNATCKLEINNAKKKKKKFKFTVSTMSDGGEQVDEQSDCKKSPPAAHGDPLSTYLYSLLDAREKSRSAGEVVMATR
jgi:hypothetical protein